VSFTADLAVSAGGKLSEVLTEDAVKDALDTAGVLVTDRLNPTHAEEVREGLGIVKQHSGAIVGLTRGAASAVLTLIAAGDSEGAISLAQAKAMTAEERLAAINSGTADAIDEGDRIRDRKNAIEAFASDVGSFVLTKALPFILCAL